MFQKPNKRKKKHYLRQEMQSQGLHWGDETNTRVYDLPISAKITSKKVRKANVKKPAKKYINIYLQV